MAMNKAAEDEMWRKWQDAAPLIYDRIYYQTNPLITYINNAGHRIMEQSLGPEQEFKRVLEVGAGRG